MKNRQDQVEYEEQITKEQLFSHCEVKHSTSSKQDTPYTALRSLFSKKNCPPSTKRKEDKYFQCIVTSTEKPSPQVYRKV